MDYSIGEYVVYGGTEICRIDGHIKKSFDGVNETDYLRLIPADAGSASYYVPEDKLSERVRPLLTEEEALSAIDSIPDSGCVWIADKNQRKLRFAGILRSSDYAGILGMINALHAERQKRSLSGKGLMSADEKALAVAHRLIDKEFAFALGIGESEVDGFIRNRLAENRRPKNELSQ